VAPSFSTCGRAPESEAIGEFQFRKRSQLFKANGKNEIARVRERQE